MSPLFSVYFIKRWTVDIYIPIFCVIMWHQTQSAQGQSNIWLNLFKSFWMGSCGGKNVLGEMTFTVDLSCHLAFLSAAFTHSPICLLFYQIMPQPPVQGYNSAIYYRRHESDSCFNQIHTHLDIIQIHNKTMWCLMQSNQANTWMRVPPLAWHIHCILTAEPLGWLHS